MKLKTHASAMGSRTSRARYKVATMITVINMALSVEDDELTADPPTSGCGRVPSPRSSEPQSQFTWCRSVPSLRLCRVSSQRRLRQVASAANASTSFHALSGCRSHRLKKGCYRSTLPKVNCQLRAPEVLRRLGAKLWKMEQHPSSMSMFVRT